MWKEIAQLVITTMEQHGRIDKLTPDLVIKVGEKYGFTVPELVNAGILAASESPEPKPKLPWRATHTGHHAQKRRRR
jgi:hypothetical protein